MPDALHLIRGLKASRNGESMVLWGGRLGSIQGLTARPSLGVLKPPPSLTSPAWRGSGSHREDQPSPHARCNLLSPI